jgi:hypothetical protein
MLQMLQCSFQRHLYRFLFRADFMVKVDSPNVNTSLSKEPGDERGNHLFWVRILIDY